MTSTSDKLQELLKQDILQSVSIADELGRRADLVSSLCQLVNWGIEIAGIVPEGEWDDWVSSANELLARAKRDHYER